MCPTKKNIIEFRKSLLTWFDQHGRHDLPWQKKTNPYRVWISEIMLQQTQVTTVIPYYQRFIKSFSNVKSLATAKLDDVLAHWSGLGYYARARNLHRAANIIHTKYHGQFPKTVDDLSALPGIGRSTAGAILSLAMNIPATILDGNVKRVLMRYHTIEGQPNKADVIGKLWSLAEQYSPTERCKDYTQAMMDLGALVCTRTQPHCSICPLNKTCQAYTLEQTHAFPQKKSTLAKPIKSTHLLLLSNTDGAILLEKRPPLGIWGSLWSFPECPLDADITQWCSQKLHCQIKKQHLWPTVYHQFTHFCLEIKPILLQITKASHTMMESEGQVWYKNTSSLPGGVPAPVTNLLKQYFENKKI